MVTAIAGRFRVAASRLAHNRLIQPRTTEDRNERLLYLSTGVMGIPFSGIIAFLPVFMARLGASSTLISWLTSAPALLSLFVVIPGAAIIERFTDQVRVRVVFSIVYRGFFLACALVPMLVAPEYLPVALIIIWTIKTLPESMMVTAWTAVMTDAISPARRARLNGNRWAILAIVSAIGSAGFGWLLDQIPFPMNYQTVFAISAAVGWIDPFFFSRIVVPSSVRPHVERIPSLLARLRRFFGPILHHRAFLLFLGCTLGYRVALNMPAPLFSVFWVRDLQVADTLIGLRGTIANGALVVGYIFWGRSANRLGHRRVLWMAALGLALYPIITGLSRSPAMLFPAAAVWGLTASGIDVGLFDLMLGTIPQQRKPLFIAFWSLAANTAVFVGPLIGAQLSQALGAGTALIVCGVTQAVTTALFVFLPRDV